MKVMNFKNNGGFREFYTEVSEIADYIKENINFLIENLQKENAKLQYENTLLKENRFIKELENENLKLKERLARSYEITPQMRTQMREFENKHSHDNRYSFHHEIHPTHLDDMVYYVCDICKEKIYLGGL